MVKPTSNLRKAKRMLNSRNVPTYSAVELFNLPGLDERVVRRLNDYTPRKGAKTSQWLDPQPKVGPESIYGSFTI